MVLNDQKVLICHKNQTNPTQPNPNSISCEHPDCLILSFNQFQVAVYIYPNSHRRQDVTHSQFLHEVKLSLNSFSYTGFLTKAKESSLLYYFPIAGGRTYRFMLFNLQ